MRNREIQIIDPMKLAKIMQANAIKHNKTARGYNKRTINIKKCRRQARALLRRAA